VLLLAALSFTEIIYTVLLNTYGYGSIGGMIIDLGKIKYTENNLFDILAITNPAWSAMCCPDLGGEKPATNSLCMTCAYYLSFMSWIQQNCHLPSHVKYFPLLAML
jgi:hypothetical protein